MTKRDSGFTMVEALVVLGVVSVLMTLAVPGMTVFIEGSQADSNTSYLYTSLLLARSEAATRNSMVSLCKIDPAIPTSCDNTENWQSGWIAFEDSNADGVRDAGEEIVDTNTGLSGNASVTSTDYVNVISYLPWGGITTNGSINICINNAIANEIFINATGRPRTAESVCP